MPGNFCNAHMEVKDVQGSDAVVLRVASDNNGHGAIGKEMVVAYNLQPIPFLAYGPLSPIVLKKTLRSLAT